MNKYLELSKKIEAKQLIERMILELEYNFFVCLESEISKKKLINDSKYVNNFSEEEYDDFLTVAIDVIKEKKQVILEFDKEKIYWVNEIGTKN